MASLKKRKGRNAYLYSKAKFRVIHSKNTVLSSNFYPSSIDFSKYCQKMISFLNICSILSAELALAPGSRPADCLACLSYLLDQCNDTFNVYLLSFFISAIFLTNTIYLTNAMILSTCIFYHFLSQLFT